MWKRVHGRTLNEILHVREYFQCPKFQNRGKGEFSVRAFFSRTRMRKPLKSGLSSHAKGFLHAKLFPFFIWGQCNIRIVKERFIEKSYEKSIKICNREKAKRGENIVMQQRRAVASSSNNSDEQNRESVLFHFFIHWHSPCRLLPSLNFWQHTLHSFLKLNYNNLFGKIPSEMEVAPLMPIYIVREG